MCHRIEPGCGGSKPVLKRFSSMFMKRLSKSDLKIFIDFYKDSAKDFYKKVFRGSLQIGTRQGVGGGAVRKGLRKGFRRGSWRCFYRCFWRGFQRALQKAFQRFLQSYLHLFDASSLWNVIYCLSIEGNKNRITLCAFDIALASCRVWRVGHNSDVTYVLGCAFWENPKTNLWSQITNHMDSSLPK